MSGLLADGGAVKGEPTWAKWFAGRMPWKGMEGVTSWYYSLCFLGTIMGTSLLKYGLCAMMVGLISGPK